MPATPQHALVIFSLLLLAAAAAMLTALFWFLRQILTYGPILPPWPAVPRRVPWGAGTVLLVVLTWGVVNISLSTAYLAVRSHFRIQSAAKPPAATAPRAAKPDSHGTDRATSPVPLLSFTEQMVLVTLINGILVVVLPIGLRLTSGASARDLGLVSDNLGRNIKLGAVAFLVVTPIVMGVNICAQLVWRPNRHPLEKMLREEANPALIALAYLAAVVLAPAAEELIFRGVIQGWLRRLVLGATDTDLEKPALPDPDGVSDLFAGTPAPGSGRVFRWLPRLPVTFSPRQPLSEHPYTAPQADVSDKAGLPLWRDYPIARRALPVVLTSAFFALVHYEQMPAPLAIFPLSIALGLLYETTESLVPSFVLHALFNGFNTSLLVGALLVGSGAKP